MKLFAFPILLSFLSLFCSIGLAQNNPWLLQKSTQLEVPPKWESLPETYLAYTLDVEQIREDLIQSPQAYQGHPGIEFLFPMPNGTYQRFMMTQSVTIPEALMQRYPSIRTYQGKGIDHPSQTIRVELTDKGLHAMILGSGQTAFVEPYGGTLHIVYWQKEMEGFHQRDLICETDDWQPDDPQLDLNPQRSIDGDLLLYRAAIAGSQEYTAFHGGLSGALGAIAVVLNRVNGIFEREMGVQLQLIPNNDLIIYTGPDPYTQGDNGAMINENQANLDAVIGSANYDIGHLFAVLTAGSVGRAFLSSVCQAGIKGGAVSALSSPVGDGFVLPAVAHEMGHQFGATHTFNTNTVQNGCGNNRTGATAYEPGSGSTLMSYAGACPPHNVAANADDFYHGGSLIQIHEFTRNGGGASCPTPINSMNQKPTISIDTGGFVIPILTPFELSASATDPDGDSITYCWEQFDLGPAGHPAAAVGNAPLFRSFQPRPDSNRIFPRIQQVIGNTQSIGENLPDYKRDMNFLLTVRDLEGGVNQAEIGFETSANAGPFLVSYPNDLISTPWIGGTHYQIQWDVANTDMLPVNCQNVTIHLSVNGGFDFPYLLAESVPNTGSAWVLIPEVSSPQCRIRVRAADNIFFDISNINFSIEAPIQPGVSLVATEDTLILCAGNEQELLFYSSSLFGFSDSVNLSILSPGLPDGISSEFSPNPFFPGDTIVLQVSGGDTSLIGTYPLSLAAISLNSGVASTSNIDFLIQETEYPSMVQALSPVSQSSIGSSGVVFSWEESPETVGYSLQVATSASFDGSIIYEQNNISTNNHPLPIDLQEGSIYYWRVAGLSACGAGPFGETEVFQTGFCELTSYDSDPVSIPVIGNPIIVTSDISLTGNGTIGTIEVRNLEGSHEAIEELEMSLTSPMGTEVILFSQECPNQSGNFLLNFSENGLSMIDCPPITGNTYQTQGNLNDFLGESIMGNWTLTIRDLANFEGGEVQNWGLLICDPAPEAPVLVKNLGLLTEQWSLDTITQSFLHAFDFSGNLTYTVLTLPYHGGLQLSGVDLDIGSQFSQQDIDQGLLTYLNNGSLAEQDSFRFDLTNVAGGWSGVYDFSIEIDKNPNTSIASQIKGPSIDIYPNPVTEELSILLDEVEKGQVEIALYSVHGTLLIQENELVQKETHLSQVNMSGLSTGLYVLRISTKTGTIFQRVVKK